MATIPPARFTVTLDRDGVHVTQVTARGRPNPFRCDRCHKPRLYRPPDEACCNWLGRYRGRHRRER